MLHNVWNIARMTRGFLVGNYRIKDFLLIGLKLLIASSFSREPSMVRASFISDKNVFNILSIKIIYKFILPIMHRSFNTSQGLEIDIYRRGRVRASDSSDIVFFFRGWWSRPLVVLNIARRSYSNHLRASHHPFKVVDYRSCVIS